MTPGCQRSVAQAWPRRLSPPNPRARAPPPTTEWSLTWAQSLCPQIRPCVQVGALISSTHWPRYFHQYSVCWRLISSYVDLRVLSNQLHVSSNYWPSNLNYKTCLSSLIPTDPDKMSFILLNWDLFLRCFVPGCIEDTPLNMTHLSNSLHLVITLPIHWLTLKCTPITH